jgi:hypothetical protein
VLSEQSRLLVPVSLCRYIACIGPSSVNNSQNFSLDPTVF